MTYTMPEARVGSKWTTDYRPTKDIAADIRADIKAAQKTGHLPADMKVSVRTSLFAGGSAIDVTLKGWDTNRIWIRGNDGMIDGLTTEARTVLHRVEEIHQSYNRDASDSMVDYFDVTYYGTVEWDWRTRL